MTLDTVMKEMVTAMKAKDKARKDVISSLVDAIKKTAIDKNCRNNIPEDMVDAVILKEQKTVQEMIDTCPVARTDLLESYKYRLEVIKEFAPTLMTEDEIRAFINEELIELTQVVTEPIGPKMKGMIMKNIMPKLKGKADGKLINKVLTELLNQ